MLTNQPTKIFFIIICQQSSSHGDVTENKNEAVQGENVRRKKSRNAGKKQSKSRSKWSPRRKKQEQAKNTITQRKLRIKKKEEPRAVESAFKTRQAAGKAIKKAAQALPSTPRRKSEVILKPAQENSVLIQPKCKRTLNFPDLEMEQLVTNFYEQDDISRQLRGKKDYVTVMEKGVKTQKQKKILLIPYECF